MPQRSVDIARIGRLLAEQNKTWDDLESHFGGNERTVQRIRSGKVTNPQKRTVRMISEYLGVAAKDILKSDATQKSPHRVHTSTIVKFTICDELSIETKHSQRASSQTKEELQTAVSSFVEQRGGTSPEWVDFSGSSTFSQQDGEDSAVLSALYCIQFLQVFNIEYRDRLIVPLRLRAIAYKDRFESIEAIDADRILDIVGQENRMCITAAVYEHLGEALRSQFVAMRSVDVGDIAVLIYAAVDSSGKYVSWEEIERIARQLTEEMLRDKFKPDIVIGVGRGSSVFGGLLAHSLGNIPIRVCDRETSFPSCTERTLTIVGYDPSSTGGKNVLVVSGEVIQGQQLEMLLGFVQRSGPNIVRTAALYHHENSILVPDYFGFSTRTAVRPAWRINPAFTTESAPF